MTREQWLKIPITERIKQLSNDPYDFDKYLTCVRRLYQRFSKNGYVVISIGLNPAPYRILEDMAWMKYVVKQ